MAQNFVQHWALLHPAWVYIFDALSRRCASCLIVISAFAPKGWKTCLTRLQRYRPDGEIGRRKGLKIPRSLNVPVRPRLRAPNKIKGLHEISHAGPCCFRSAIHFLGVTFYHSSGGCTAGSLRLSSGLFDRPAAAESSTAPASSRLAVPWLWTRRRYQRHCRCLQCAAAACQ